MGEYVFLYFTTRKNRLSKIIEEEEFRKFHDFLFNYHLVIPGKRTLIREEVEYILEIEFGKRYETMCKLFINFMTENNIDKIDRVEWRYVPEVFEALTSSKIPNKSCTQLA